ncbi:hypothetical protein [Cohnella caldifontis]|uniref:hypothetical protein n=1 Tax=Cohnella caldifontis TaxID=3027471 RepID=UPI0023EE0149|nr:hypothetical protein [Cohnella sp. YIM B05605]
MLTKLDNQAFQSMDDDALIAACAQSAFETVRSADMSDGEVRADRLEWLTPPQRDLLFYRIYELHATKSADDFRWWTSYFLPRDNLWSGIKRALASFGGGSVLNALEAVERASREPSDPESGQEDDSPSTFIYTDSRLAAPFAEAFRTFQQQVPELRRRIATRIRNHPGEFIEFADKP